MDNSTMNEAATEPIVLKRSVSLSSANERITRSQRISLRNKMERLANMDEEEEASNSPVIKRSLSTSNERISRSQRIGMNSSSNNIIDTSATKNGPKEEGSSEGSQTDSNETNLHFEAPTKKISMRSSLRSSMMITSNEPNQALFLRRTRTTSNDRISRTRNFGLRSSNKMGESSRRSGMEESSRRRFGLRSSRSSSMDESSKRYGGQRVIDGTIGAVAAAGHLAAKGTSKIVTDAAVGAVAVGKQAGDLGIGVVKVAGGAVVGVSKAATGAVIGTGKATGDALVGASKVATKAATGAVHGATDAVVTSGRVAMAAGAMVGGGVVQTGKAASDAVVGVSKVASKAATGAVHGATDAVFTGGRVASDVVVSTGRLGLEVARETGKLGMAAGAMVGEGVVQTGKAASDAVVGVSKVASKAATGAVVGATDAVVTSGRVASDVVVSTGRLGLEVARETGKLGMAAGDMVAGGVVQTGKVAGKAIVGTTHLATDAAVSTAKLGLATGKMAGKAVVGTGQLLRNGTRDAISILTGRVTRGSHVINETPYAGPGSSLDLQQFDQFLSQILCMEIDDEDCLNELDQCLDMPLENYPTILQKMEVGLSSILSFHHDISDCLKCEIHTYLGLVYLEQRNHGAALDTLTKALWHQSRNTEDKLGIAMANHRLGVAYGRKRKYQQALALIEGAIEVYETEGASLEIKVAANSDKYEFLEKEQLALLVRQRPQSIHRPVSESQGYTSQSAPSIKQRSKSILDSEGKKRLQRSQSAHFSVRRSMLQRSDSEGSTEKTKLRRTKSAHGYTSSLQSMQDSLRRDSDPEGCHQKISRIPRMNLRLPSPLAAPKIMMEGSLRSSGERMKDCSHCSTQGSRNSESKVPMPLFRRQQTADGIITSAEGSKKSESQVPVPLFRRQRTIDGITSATALTA